MNQGKYVFYFDTSAVNKLANDPASEYIVNRLHETALVWISAYVAAELLLTGNPARRDHLCRTATSLQMPYAPLAPADEILRRSLSGLLENREIIDVSLSCDSDAVWQYVADPRNIDPGSIALLREQVAQWEENYGGFLHNGRGAMQTAMAAARARGERRLDGYAGWLLRQYVRDPQLVHESARQVLKQIPGAPTSDEVIDHVFAELEVWRFYLIGIAHDIYSRAVQVGHFGRRSNTNWIDTQQVVYLRNCHVFVTHDMKQRRMLRYADLFGIVRRSVWTYDQLVEWIKRGCPRLPNLDRISNAYVQPVPDRSPVIALEGGHARRFSSVPLILTGTTSSQHTS